MNVLKKSQISLPPQTPRQSLQMTLSQVYHGIKRNNVWIVKGMLKSVTKDWITGRFLLTFEVDSDVSSDINKLADKMLTLAVKVYRKKRSLDANAYYWQLITKLAEASG